MTTSSRYYPNLYKDSVSLMTVSAQIMSIDGIDTASVVMASATNIDNLTDAGLGPFDVRPNDLLVALSGTPEACEEALTKADDLLTQTASAGEVGAVAAQPVTSIQMAVTQDRATTSSWCRYPATTPRPRG